MFSLRCLLWTFGLIGLCMGQDRMLAHLTREDGGFSTRIIVMNPTDEDESCWVYPFAQDGQAMEPIQVTVNRGSSMDRTVTSMIGSENTSHLVIEKETPLLFMAAYQSNSVDSCPAHVAECGVQARRWCVVPGNWEVAWDGIAVVNLGRYRTDVYVRQVSPNGQVVDEYEALDALEPCAKGLFLFHDHFEPIDGAHFILESEEILAVVALRGTFAEQRPGYLWENTSIPLDSPVTRLDPDPVVGEVALIYASTFQQGSDPVLDHCISPNEIPFEHTLTRDIVVMKTEVTGRMWSDLRTLQPSLMEDPSRGMFSGGLSAPVQNVSWYETFVFANLLSLELGLERCYFLDETFETVLTAENFRSGPVFCDFNASGYRLPTEGEWEYFARAGTLGSFSCNETEFSENNCESEVGLQVLRQHAVYLGEGIRRTQHVRSKLPNPWGLYDVHGNVWEWCWDLYGEYPGRAVTDYQGSPPPGSMRIIRGGGWNSFPSSCRSAKRGQRSPANRNENTGFRLVRTYPGP